MMPCAPRRAGSWKAGFGTQTSSCWSKSPAAWPTLRPPIASSCRERPAARRWSSSILRKVPRPFESGTPLPIQVVALVSDAVVRNQLEFALPRLHHDRERVTCLARHVLVERLCAQIELWHLHGHLQHVAVRAL